MLASWYDRNGPAREVLEVGELPDPLPGPGEVRVRVHGAQSYRAFGTAAQYTVVPAHLAVPLPDHLSDELGASLGIPGITAHRTVFADGPVDGRVVLVHGVLGAVGSLAGALTVEVGHRYPLDEIAKAHEHVDAGSRGRVLVTIPR